MKILIVNSLYPPDVLGGAERSVKFLAEAVAKQGHRVYVLCTAKSRRAERASGVVIIRFTPAQIYWFADQKRHYAKILWHIIEAFNVFSLPSYVRLLMRIRPDVVHTNNLAGFSSSFLCACALLRIPVIHTLRDYYLICAKSDRYKLGKQCTGVCVECKILTLPRRAMARAAIVSYVGNSRRIVELHDRCGLAISKKSSVIYNGYSKECLDEQGREILVNVPRQKLVVGFLGQISRRKGAEVLLQAAELVKHFEISFVFAGRVDEEIADRFANLPENTRVLGFVKPDVFFRQIHVLAIPALWEEPLPRVAIEALNWGKPVITSLHGGTSEILEDEVTGFVLKDTSPQCVADLLMKLSVRQVIEMAAKCCSAGSRFDPSNTARSYIEAYGRVANFQ